MLIVCAGFALFSVNALPLPTLMIASGAPACFVNEANRLDTFPPPPTLPERAIN